MSPLIIAIDIACLAVGVGIGYVLGVRHNRKLDVLDPEHAPHKSKFNVKNVVGVLLFIMAIFIVVSTSQTNDQTKLIAEQQVATAQAQGSCNDEFFRVLAERTKITADDNKLNREDAIALQQLVQQLLAVPPPTASSPEATFTALKTYQDTINSNNEKREANNRERAQNPYPEPRCGN